MKIRFTAPEWFKRKRKKRKVKIYQKKNYDYDWINILSSIIPAFIVLLVGFSLVGPISEVVSGVKDNITNNKSIEGNLSTEVNNPVFLDIFSNKFFLFLFLVVIPFLLFKNIFRGLSY